MNVLDESVRRVAARGDSGTIYAVSAVTTGSAVSVVGGSTVGVVIVCSIVSLTSPHRHIAVLSVNSSAVVAESRLTVVSLMCRGHAKEMRHYQYLIGVDGVDDPSYTCGAKQQMNVRN